MWVLCANVVICYLKNIINLIDVVLGGYKHDDR